MQINSKYIIDNTLWYLINSYNYTQDMGLFTNENKKLQRLIVWNVLEYTVMYFLNRSNIFYKTDKNNPFKTDIWTDIIINNINIHCKWSLLKPMVWQIRNGKKIIDDLNNKWWYLLIGYINRELVDKVIKLLELYISNWWVLATNYELVWIEEILKTLNININYDYFFNEKTFIKNISIYWLLSIDDFFNNSVFVWFNEKIPWTNMTQFFEEWSYFLDTKFNNYIQFSEILKNNA